MNAAKQKSQRVMYCVPIQNVSMITIWKEQTFACFVVHYSPKNAKTVYLPILSMQGLVINAGQVC